MDFKCKEEMSWIGRYIPMYARRLNSKRKLDLTDASEMNRLYPNSRRERWKMNGDCKTKLAAGTVVEIEAGASLFTDPISDAVKCI
ncbi:hypothetical protein TNCV_4371861 [Trichonephila clavipes]|nr:hypothetical protein TNCV_4371861 [Trichonephila clavipes]